MRALVAAVLVLAASVPAAAMPLASVPSAGWPLALGMSFYGLAMQGSQDASSGWLLAPSVCSGVQVPLRYELHVLAGASGDEVRFRLPYSEPDGVLARFLQPAVLDVPAGSSCDPFTVEGVRVGSAALYRLDILEPLA